MTYNILSALEVARPRGRWLTAASLTFFVIGTLVLWRRSGDWYGLFVSLFLTPGSRGR
jgi:hypothetical protein